MVLNETQNTFRLLDREMKSTRLSETFRDFQRLSETFRDFQRLLDTIRDYKRLSETFRQRFLDIFSEFQRFSVTIRYFQSFQRFSETFKDFQRFFISNIKLKSTYVLNCLNVFPSYLATELHEAAAAACLPIIHDYSVNKFLLAAQQTQKFSSFTIVTK